MQYPNNDRADRFHRSVGHLRLSFRQLYRVDTIIVNLIALTLCGLLAILLQTDWLLPHPAGSHHYLIVGIELLAAIQVIRSGKKSLLLPTICLCFGLAGLLLQHFHFANSLSAFYLQAFVIIGSLGLGLAVLNIR